MNITLYDFVYICSNAFTVYVIKRFYDTFFQLKKGYKLWATGAYFLYFAGTTGLYFGVDIPIINLIANIVLLFVITLCYDSTLKRKVLAVSGMYIIIFLTELFISTLTQTSYVDPLKHYGYTNELGLFVSRIVIFSIVLLTNHFATKKSKKELPFWLYGASLFIPVITIIIEVMMTATNGTSKAFVSVSIVLLFSVNVLVFFLYDALSAAYERVMKSTIIEQEREYYHNQCLLMQEAAEKVRAFQHDMSNHFSVIDNLLQNGNDDKVSEYVHNLISRENSIPVAYSKTGNIAIDSIINYKLSKATLYDITVSVDIIVPTEISVEIMDLSTILANLLDNALQALEKVKENKQLSVNIKYRKGVLLICISNTYNGIVKFENGEIITTKEKPREHGYGLRNVEAVAQKYDGVCNFTHDNTIFKADVLLYV